MTPFTYIPDELIDCGDLIGEHPIEFTAWISAREPDKKPIVQITQAIVKVVFGEIEQNLDITARINRESYVRDHWEDEILRAYEGAHEAQFEEGA